MKYKYKLVFAGDKTMYGRKYFPSKKSAILHRQKLKSKGYLIQSNDLLIRGVFRK